MERRPREPRKGEPRGRSTHCPDGTVSLAPGQASGSPTRQGRSVRSLSEHWDLSFPDCDTHTKSSKHITSN